jgi:hypothetical protein
LRNDLISYFTTLDYDFNSKYGLAASYRMEVVDLLKKTNGIISGL